MKTPRGFVYIATSPLLKAVKIGSWRGDLKGLRRRYRTPYGPDLQIHSKEVADCRWSEALSDGKFDEHRLGGELFDVAYMNDYFDCLTALDCFGRVEACAGTAM